MTVDLASTDVDAAPAGRRPADWIALHVFYAANPAPMLSECIGPLIEELQSRDLLHRWFFIRYWVEGPHIRLRLRAVSAERVEEVKAITEDALRRFLQRRPAVYDVPTEAADAIYRQLFLAEYTEEDWNAKYGETGMPIRDNNSFAYLDYEPEYVRYGGPAGIELSEWQFQKSSEMALRLLSSTNVHVRTVLLGAGAQLMTVACRTFVPDADAAIEFLRNYGSYWETTFLDPDPKRDGKFDEAYDEMEGSLARRAGEISELIQSGHLDQLSGFVQDWALHFAELRGRITELVDAGALEFPARRGQRDEADRVVADDVEMTLQVLLSSYIHMTNNRLGLAIGDEVYLSYVVRRAMIEYRDSGTGVRMATALTDE